MLLAHPPLLKILNGMIRRKIVMISEDMKQSYRLVDLRPEPSRPRAATYAHSSRRSRPSAWWGLSTNHKDIDLKAMELKWILYLPPNASSARYAVLPYYHTSILGDLDNPQALAEGIHWVCQMLAHADAEAKTK